MEIAVSKLLDTFEAGQIDPAHFPHVHHVKVAYALLRKYDFPAGLLALSRGLTGIARQSGAPEKYNETITGAFLSVISERILTTPSGSYAEFERANPDLLKRDFLDRIYPEHRLRSEIAHRTFLLPIGGPYE